MSRRRSVCLRIWRRRSDTRRATSVTAQPGVALEGDALGLCLGLLRGGFVIEGDGIGLCARVTAEDFIGEVWGRA